MQDQPSTCDDNGEPRPRPKTIPDDFIWDAETQAWYAPGTPSKWDSEAFRRDLEEVIRQRESSGGLVSRDQLLAAGALDRPPELRKSLRARVKRDKRDQLPLFGDADTAPD